jgi:autoinducer 2-degrading protein
VLALWVKVRVRPEARQRFLEAIEADALGSERDEAGCLRFNVLQDAADPEVYYFYEVYRDQQALEAHRETPHFRAWLAVRACLDSEPEVLQCRTLFPAEARYWAKP